MDPDEAILDRVAAHLDAVAAARPTGAGAPRDLGVDPVVEVPRVELVVDLAKIVVLAGREDHLRRRAACATRT